jgi:hypothetical protein
MRLLDGARLIRIMSVVCLDRCLLILLLASVLRLHRLLLVLLLASVLWLHGLLILLLASILRLHGLLGSRSLGFLDVAGVAAHGVERETALLATLEKVENSPSKGCNKKDPVIISLTDGSQPLLTRC